MARAIQCDTYSLPKISAKVASGEKLDLWLQARAKMYELMDRYDDAIADYNALEQELKDTYAPSAWDVATARNTRGTTFWP